MTSNENKLYLPLEYKPTSLDVLSGRGKGNNSHAGNLKFLNMVKINLQKYINAPSRIHKSVIIDDTLEKLLTLDLQFLKQHKQTRKWHILNRRASYDRVAHTFRDLKYKATKKNKNRRASKMILQTKITKPNRNIRTVTHERIVIDEHLAFGSINNNCIMMEGGYRRCSLAKTYIDLRNEDFKCFKF